MVYGPNSREVRFVVLFYQEKKRENCGKAFYINYSSRTNSCSTFSVETNPLPFIAWIFVGLFKNMNQSFLGSMHIHRVKGLSTKFRRCDLYLCTPIYIYIYLFIYLFCFFVFFNTGYYKLSATFASTSHRFQKIHRAL